MRVVAIGYIGDKYVLDDLPERGIVIEASLEELQNLPNILNREVEVTEKEGGRE